MRAGPSRIAEAIVAVFVPPACREEVLGDLYERYRSAGQYGLDAARTIPLVILSRIRRTADPPVLLMQALTLYASFLAAAWLEDRAFLTKQWGLMRIAFPAAAAILGLLLEDAYARPGWRSPLKLVRGPMLGLGLALASQVMLRIGSPDLALPVLIACYGCALSLLLSSAVRMMFPPASDQLQGVNVPADWLKRSGSHGNAESGTRFLIGVTAVATVVMIGAWMLDRALFPKARGVVLFSLVLLLVYQVWRQD
jgi:hypothetical protein